MKSKKTVTDLMSSDLLADELTDRYIKFSLVFSHFAETHLVSLHIQNEVSMQNFVRRYVTQILGIGGLL
jgi:hypothetical protein